MHFLTDSESNQEESGNEVGVMKKKLVALTIVVTVLMLLGCIQALFLYENENIVLKSAFPFLKTDINSMAGESNEVLETESKDKNTFKNRPS